MRLPYRPLVALCVLGATPAFAAAGGEHAASSEVLFLVQIICLLVVGRLLGEVMQRIGQPGVVGQLLAGMLLGPSFFGAVWPAGQHAIFPPGEGQKAMLDAVAQIGVLLLLLLTGMETDLGLVRRVRRAALSVSVAGVAVPFACGFALGQVLPEAMLPHPELRMITSLFLGTALSISSVKIVAMVVREMGFLRRNVGQVIVASAIIDDTIGWVIIAITFSLALNGAFDVWSLGKSLLGTALFLGLSFTLGRRVVFLLIRWANDELVSEAAVITTILVVMGAMALATQAIGVHTVLGAFVAGILVGQSPILTRQIDQQLRGLVTALFAPVFFGLAGLSADLTILSDPHLLGLTIGLIAIASLGKFAGAFIGGTLGGLRRAECMALACGMNARGSTEVIVATIGLSIGALSQNLFTMIVAMAILTTLAMPPMLRWALGRLPLDEAERKRLEREAFEERGFVPNLERLLVVADESAEGRFASRLAGLVAGMRGMAATVIRLDGKPRLAQAARQPGALEAVVAGTARAVQERVVTPDEDVPDAVEVIERHSALPMEQAVSVEAGKGYDLLMVGMESQRQAIDGPGGSLAKVMDAFEGPLAVVVPKGEHLGNPEAAPLSILVAVNGTAVSRRGAEVALNLARASGAPVTALLVSNAGDTSRRRRRLTGGLRRRDEAVLRDVVDTAERVGVPVRTAVRIRMATEDAILRQVRLGKHNLIVVGVARRPGEGLAFGEVADALLDTSDRSLLFLAS
jgi:Kef-type K+ transport system membrane component KefB/nucleotide-binding universal stress UspA family protein